MDSPSQPTSDAVPTRVRSPRGKFLVGGAVVLAALLVGWLVWWHSKRQEATSRGQAAEEALRSYRFEEALDGFEAYLRRWPDDPAVRLQAARAARRAALFDRADEHLSACEKVGRSPETALERALARAQRGDLLEVQRSLVEMVNEGHPEKVSIAEALCQGYLLAHRVELAMGAIHRLIDLAPDHPGPYFWRGGVYEAGQRFSDALKDYQRAVELAPRNPAFRLRLAEALVRRNRAEEALPHFEELLGRDPRHRQALLGSARCFRSLSKPEQAGSQLNELLAEHPDDADGWAERGLLHRDAGEHEAALRCLRKALELSPYNADLCYALSQQLQSHGSPEEARAVKERFERLRADQARLHAIPLLLSKEPKPNAALRHEAGEICARTGLEDQAVLWYFSALQDDPAHRPAHEALADYYQRKGDARTAAYHREQAQLFRPR